MHKKSSRDLILGYYVRILLAGLKKAKEKSVGIVDVSTETPLAQQLKNK